MLIIFALILCFRFTCDSRLFAVSSSCYLECNPGYVPSLEVMLTCRHYVSTGQDEWDKSLEDDFECVPAVNFVFGGVDDDTT